MLAKRTERVPSGPRYSTSCIDRPILAREEARHGLEGWLRPRQLPTRRGRVDRRFTKYKTLIQIERVAEKIR